MFTAHQELKLIEHGWAPLFDDNMQIIGFDKWVAYDKVVHVPRAFGILVKYAALVFDTCTGEVLAQKWGITPNQWVVK